MGQHCSASKSKTVITSVADDEFLPSDINGNDSNVMEKRKEKEVEMNMIYIPRRNLNPTRVREFKRSMQLKFAIKYCFNKNKKLREEMFLSNALYKPSLMKLILSNSHLSTKQYFLLQDYYHELDVDNKRMINLREEKNTRRLEREEEEREAREIDRIENEKSKKATVPDAMEQTALDTQNESTRVDKMNDGSEIRDVLIIAETHVTGQELIEIGAVSIPVKPVNLLLMGALIVLYTNDGQNFESRVVERIEKKKDSRRLANVIVNIPLSRSYPPGSRVCAFEAASVTPDEAIAHIIEVKFGRLILEFLKNKEIDELTEDEKKSQLIRSFAAFGFEKRRTILEQVNVPKIKPKKVQIFTSELCDVNDKDGGFISDQRRPHTTESPSNISYDMGGGETLRPSTALRAEEGQRLKKKYEADLKADVFGKNIHVLGEF